MSHRCAECKKAIHGPIAKLKFGNKRPKYFHPEYGCVDRMVKEAKKLRDTLVSESVLCRFQHTGDIGIGASVCSKPTGGSKSGLCQKHEAMQCSHRGCTKKVAKECGAATEEGESCTHAACEKHTICPTHSRRVQRRGRARKAPKR